MMWKLDDCRGAAHSPAIASAAFGLALTLAVLSTPTAAQCSVPAPSSDNPVASNAQDQALAETKEPLPVAVVRAKAEAGNTAAQTELGLRYANGRRGLSKDYGEALKWLRLAAEKGNAGAQATLGELIRDGRGTSKDLTEAVKWIRRAAEQGHARAENDLGELYHAGRGVPKDLDETVKWIKRAAEHGNPKAQFHLAVGYRAGEAPLVRDEVEAAKWLRKSSESGYNVAQFDLAMAYMKGNTVEKNPIEALAWLDVVCTSTKEWDPNRRRDALEKQLGPEATATARKRCEELLKLIAKNKAEAAEATRIYTDIAP